MSKLKTLEDVLYFLLGAKPAVVERILLEDLPLSFVVAPA
jgi:hypothetical protein